MAKFSDAIRDTLIGYFNDGDYPSEAQFTDLVTRIQEGIEEHNHDATGDGDGMQLDWDEIWTDGVHDHSAAGEGGATLGFTAMTGVGVDVPNGWYLGVGAALERIGFDAAGDITVMGANFSIGTETPDDALLTVYASSAGAVVAPGSSTLVIESGVIPNMTFLAPDDSYGRFAWGYPADNYLHAILGFGPTHVANPNQMRFYVNNAYVVTMRSTGVGIGMVPNANALLALATPTENTEIIDAGSAGATEQDWIEVEINGVQGYIRVFAAK